MDVSIIIINYNTFRLTSQCIRSIFNCTYGLQFEIILVDNGSFEGDPNDFLKEFPDINLIKNKNNLGFSKGNNLGIKHAVGKYILLLNSDIKLINNAVKYAYDYLALHREIGVLTGQLKYEDGRQQGVARRFPSIQRELFNLFRLGKFLSSKQRGKYYLGDEADYNFIIECDWVWGAFFMFRKSDLEYFPKGKLHEDFFMYCEDMQWCYHFNKRMKKKVVYFPKPISIHFIGGSDEFISDSDERYYKRILPNEFELLSINKGKMYAKIYYLIKYFHYSLSINNEIRSRSKIFLSISRKKK